MLMHYWKKFVAIPYHIVAVFHRKTDGEVDTGAEGVVRKQGFLDLDQKATAWQMLRAVNHGR